MILTCPNCKDLLIADTHSLKCQSGHSFDKAKAGYINLLLPNQKKTSDPGDSKQMILAREQFLSDGHYNFLIDTLNLLFESQLKLKSKKKQDLHFLDIGCGSGYYTRQLLQQKTVRKIGLDISKNSIETASKKDKTSTYLVASAFNIPLTNDSADYILNVFSPLDLNEANRILNEEGNIVKVIPGPEHMKEVAMLVYDTFKPHHTNFKSEVLNHGQFQVIEEIDLTQTITFDDDSIKNLVAMTPYRFKFTSDQFDELSSMNITVSFQILVLGKTKADISIPLSNN